MAEATRDSEPKANAAHAARDRSEVSPEPVQEMVPPILGALLAPDGLELGPPPGDPLERHARFLAGPQTNLQDANLRRQFLGGLEQRYGNSYVQRAVGRAESLKRSPGRARESESRVQRQPPTAAANPETAEPAEPRYTVRLSTGSYANLTLDEAIGKLWAAYDSLNGKVELESGEHETLKKSRDSNPVVGVGGFLADLFMGKDLPPIDMWDKPRNLLTAAKLALTSKAIEQAADTLKQAGDAYKDCRARYQSYKDDLELSGGATQVAIGAIPVAVLVIGLTVLAAAPAAAGGATAGGTATGGAATGGAATGGAATGGAATGGAATGGAATGGAATGGTAAAGGAAAGGAATGGVVVGGGVGGSVATATTMATGQTVSGIAAQAAALMASGDLQALTAMLTSVAATPAGRQAMLMAARLVVVSMQQPGVLQKEFQFLKQLSEILFQFARGGG